MTITQVAPRLEVRTPKGFLVLADLKCRITSDQEFKAMFTEHGLRDTKHRRTLYSALAASVSHPTADSLYRAIGGKTSGMSMATVYNCLEAFCRSGLVRRHVDIGGTTRYDATIDDHVHLCCEETGEFTDVPEQLGDLLLKRISKNVLKKIEQEIGFKIDRVQVELVGKHTSPPKRNTCDQDDGVQEVLEVK